MGLDALDFGREPFGDARPMVNFPLWIRECDFCMRIDNACHSKVLPYTLTPFLILGLHLSGDFGTMLLRGPIFIVPNFSPLVLFCGFIFTCIKADVDNGRRRFTCYFGANVSGLAGGQLTVHDDASDSNSLLTS